MAERLRPRDLRDKVEEYFKINTIKEGERGCYDEAAIRFGLTSEQIRRLYRTYKDNQEFDSEMEDPASDNSGESFKEDIASGNAETTVITAKRIKTLEDLIAACNIDTKVWDIVSYEVNKWEVGRKNKSLDLTWVDGKAEGNVKDSGTIFVEPLFQVKAKLKRKTFENSPQKQAEAFMALIRDYKPIAAPTSIITDIPNKEDRRSLYEINLPDLHLGSLSWGEEAGENYDIKIAERRFKDCIKDLISRVNLSRVERFMIPLGNDFFNIDYKTNTTSNGTLVETDCRYQKMVLTGTRIIFETIDELALVAPVDIIMVPGNHDFISNFWLGIVLTQRYLMDERITVDNRPENRKYYQYGKVGFQLTHGDEEKHSELGLIFANEEKHLWADTEFHYCQLGHYHKNKTISYLSKDEYVGFQIQVLPTLSSLNAWANRKGYNSLRQGKAFEYDRDRGCIGEFTYTAQ